MGGDGITNLRGPWVVTSANPILLQTAKKEITATARTCVQPWDTSNVNRYCSGGGNYKASTCSWCTNTFTNAPKAFNLEYFGAEPRRPNLFPPSGGAGAIFWLNSLLWPLYGIVTSCFYIGIYVLAMFCNGSGVNIGP